MDGKNRAALRRPCHEASQHGSCGASSHERPISDGNVDALSSRLCQCVHACAAVGMGHSRSASEPANHSPASS